MAVVCVGWLVVHTLAGHQPAPALAVDLNPGLTSTAEVRPTRTAQAAPPPLTLDVPAVRPALMVRHVSTPVAIRDDEPTTVTTAASELAPGGDAVAADDPKRLMAAGLSAEARGDYAGAVKQYERIESLSSDEWPTDLKDRLTLARAAGRGD